MLAEALYNGVISRLLQENKEFNFLEIGSYHGDGIKMLSNKFPDRKFYSIDPFIEDGFTEQWSHKLKGESLQDIRIIFEQNIADKHNVRHFDMTTEEFIKNELYKDISVDILFIDGDHSFEGATLDLSLAVLLAEGKTIYVIMDDLQHETVFRAVDQFKETHEIEINPAEGHKTIYFTLNQ